LLEDGHAFSIPIPRFARELFLEIITSRASKISGDYLRFPGVKPGACFAGRFQPHAWIYEPALYPLNQPGNFF
jgi:hypothetical protein